MPLEDHDRPLNPRGVRSAQAVSLEIRNRLPEKYTVWSSTAKRASSTALIFADKLHWPVEQIVFKEELYTFDRKSLDTQLRACSDAVENLMVFGHNTALTDLVNFLGDKHLENVPTSGFVGLEFDIDSWKDLGNGRLTDTVFPKQLHIT